MKLFSSSLKLFLSFCFFVSLGVGAKGIYDSYVLSDTPKSTFNPIPMEGDIILPLPCEGGSNENYQIVFRKVYTHSLNESDITTDLEFSEGTLDESRALMESKRTCKVRGNFKDKYGYFYYLSKYELTQGQFEAIKTGKCKEKPSLKDALPVNNVSINDAKEVAFKFSDFLQKIDETPTNGKEKAEAILPYECYWSFAQRGGLAVSKSDLEANLPKVAGNKSIEEYAWGQGAKSSNNKLQIIGKKKPNALGFFDMLGNVSEYMNEPFQATGSDGLIGQKGGSTIRGGSFLTPLKDLTNSLRSERKTYVKGMPNKAKDVGIRLMLNVSVTKDVATVKSATQSILEKRAALQRELEEVSLKLEQGSNAELLEKYKEIEAKLNLLTKKNEAQNETIAELISEKEEIKEQAKLNAEKPIETVSKSLFIFFLVLLAVVILWLYIHFKNKSKLLALQKYHEGIDDVLRDQVKEQEKTHLRKKFNQGFVNRKK